MKSRTVMIIKYLGFWLFLICVFQKPQYAKAAITFTDIFTDDRLPEISSDEPWLYFKNKSSDSALLFQRASSNKPLIIHLEVSDAGQVTVTSTNNVVYRSNGTTGTIQSYGTTILCRAGIDCLIAYGGENLYLTLNGECIYDTYTYTVTPTNPPILTNTPTPTSTPTPTPTNTPTPTSTPSPTPTPQVKTINADSIPYNGTAKEVIDFFDLDIFGATSDDRWLFIYIDRANKGYYFKVLNDNVYRTLNLRDNGTHVDITGMYEYNIYFYGLGSCTSTSTTSSINVDNGCSADTKYYYYANCDNVTIGETLLPYVVFIDDTDENKPDVNGPTPSPTPTPLPSNFMLNKADSNDKGFTVEKAFSVEAIQDVWNEHLLTVPYDDKANYVVYEIDSEHYAEADRGVYLYLYKKDTSLYVKREPEFRAIMYNGYFFDGQYSIQSGYLMKWNYDKEIWEFVSRAYHGVTPGTQDNTADFGTVYASNQPIWEMENSYTLTGVEYYLTRKVYTNEDDYVIGTPEQEEPELETPTESPVANISTDGFGEAFDIVMKIMLIELCVNNFTFSFLELFFYCCIAFAMIFVVFSGVK